MPKNPFIHWAQTVLEEVIQEKILRKFFEVDKEHIVAYTLSALAKEQLIASKEAEQAIKKFNIDKDKAFPTKL